MKPQDYTLFNKANVLVTPTKDATGKVCAHIEVDNQLEHTFSSHSRISKHLDMMTAEDLSDRLTGGSFFFVHSDGKDHMIDFRDGNYNGFVHTEKSIDTFMDVIGFAHKSQLGLPHLQKKRGDDEIDNSPIVLRKVWDKNTINVPGYLTGTADFNSMLSFTWNPFIKTINSNFDLIRLICTNGTVGLTSFLNTKVPLMNRWEEHLNIATRQIQNKVETIVTARISNMINEHCSVSDALLLEEHVVNRMMHTTDTNEHQRLMNILAAVSPRHHLSDVYRDSVFDDKNLASQLPGHLSAFDVYNIATEVRSHTEENSKSSDRAMDKFANHLLFDREGNIVVNGAVFGSKARSAFSSPETAFWGTTIDAVTA